MSAPLTVPVTLPVWESSGTVHVTPSFSTSHSDASTGTFSTAGLEIGVDGRWMGLNATGSLSPKVDGYRNSALGGDVSFHTPPRSADESDRWTFRVDAGINAIHHTDDFQTVNTTTTVKGKVRTRVRDRSIDINETDWSASLEAARGLFDWTGEAVVSSYDKDLHKLGVRPALIAHLPGLHSTLQGFPDHHYDTRFSVGLPVVAPYVAFSHTTFELNQPLEQGYTAGGVIDVGALELDGSYERDLFDRGAPSQSYVTLSASYLF
jgi:hypothetical protein